MEFKKNFINFELKIPYELRIFLMVIFGGIGFLFEFIMVPMEPLMPIGLFYFMGPWIPGILYCTIFFVCGLSIKYDGTIPLTKSFRVKSNHILNRILVIITIYIIYVVTIGYGMPILMPGSWTIPILHFIGGFAMNYAGTLPLTKEYRIKASYILTGLSVIISILIITEIIDVNKSFLLFSFGSLIATDFQVNRLKTFKPYIKHISLIYLAFPLTMLVARMSKHTDYTDNPLGPITGYGFPFPIKIYAPGLPMWGRWTNLFWIDLLFSLFFIYGVYFLIKWKWKNSNKIPEKSN